MLAPALLWLALTPAAAAATRPVEPSPIGEAWSRLAQAEAPPDPTLPDARAPDAAPPDAPYAAPGEVPPSSAPPLHGRPVVASPNWDGLSVGFTQILTGCGVNCASIPLNVCTFGAWGCVAEPFFVGYFETWVGDALGRGRAAAIWPTLTAFAFGAAGLASSIALNVALPLDLATPERAFAGASLRNLIIRSSVAAGIGVAGAVAIPVSYALSSEPKHPNDPGGLPGIFTPGHPEQPPAPSTSVVRRGAGVDVVAMAY